MLKIEILFYFGAIDISTNQQTYKTYKPTKPTNLQNLQINKTATIMKGAYTVASVLATAIWHDQDDASCATTVPTFEGATNKQERFKKKQKNKKKGGPSEKALARRSVKKMRERAIAKKRDRREDDMHPYEQSTLTYVKSKGTLERMEDEFSDKNIYLYQWEDVPLHGPHKEGVIPRHAYEISMWYKSLMKPPPVPVKRVHRVYYGSELVLLTQSLKSIELHGRRVSWADDNKQKLVSLVKYIPARKPANCYLASRSCFMRMQCFCESK